MEYQSGGYFVLPHPKEDVTRKEIKPHVFYFSISVLSDEGPTEFGRVYPLNLKSHLGLA